MSSKNKLISTALMSFMLEGYQKTSLSKIADQIGISKPALYYYFPNKKALFIACLEVFFQQISDNAKLDVKKGGTVKKRLNNIIKSFSEPALLNGGLEGFNHYYFVFDAMKHVSEVKDMLLDSSGSFMTSLTALIQEGIDNGEIRDDIDIEAVLIEIGVFIEGMAVSNYLGYFDSIEGMVDRIIELIWSGISGR